MKARIIKPGRDARPALGRIVAKKKNSSCVMGYTREAGIFARMSAESKLSRQIFENDGHEKMTAKKTIMANAVTSSCAFPAQGRLEILPEWDSLGTFVLCRSYTSGARISDRVTPVGDIHFVQ